MAMQDDEATLAHELFEKIDRSERGKLSLKIKTLMALFGFNAEHRVRQASLDGVLDQLSDWGIVCSFPSASRTAHDWLTLSRAARPPGPPPRPAGPGGAVAAAAPAAPATVAHVDGGFSPLHLRFRIDDAATEGHSRALLDDIVDHVWAFRPLCLVVEGDEADLAFAGAMLGAMMRRRALFVPNLGGDSCPLAPEIAMNDTFRRIVGRAEGRESLGFTPIPGTVILVRSDEEDLRAEEILALLRDVLVPHTYRLRARAETALDGVAETAFASWLAAFTGAPGLASGLVEKLAERKRRVEEGPAGARTTFDLAALVTNAVQAMDALLDRACERGLPKDFRASNESTEHMALKASAWRDLVGRHGAGAVRMEQTFDAGEAGQPDDELGPTLAPPKPAEVLARTCRPDLRVEGKRWLEIETLRGRAKQFRDPFFELERRMLKPVLAAATGEEIELIVPSDVAMLASRRLETIVSNLRSVREDVRVTWGFVDLENDAIVRVDMPAREASRVELTASSWRQRSAPKEARLTWSNVAGYSDVQRRLREDVLDPLREPARYRRHGLTSSNALLLYGLPGCGKSLLGRVLAGEAGIACKVLVPSDLTSQWLGAGVAKVREAFDWALDQDDGCLLVLDEIDAVAPVRAEQNMHSDEKRQVSELLVQLDRVRRSKKPIIIVGTTNYVRGIDGAIRRSGRFDVKIPVFPPEREDREALFGHFVGQLAEFDVNDVLDAMETLAEKTPLFAPADIESVVNLAAKRAVYAAKGEAKPRLTSLALRGIIEEHQRSISRSAAEQWLQEARSELGAREAKKLAALQGDLEAAYPG